MPRNGFADGLNSLVIERDRTGSPMSRSHQADLRNNGDSLREIDAAQEKANPGRLEVLVDCRACAPPVAGIVASTSLAT